MSECICPPGKFDFACRIHSGQAAAQADATKRWTLHKSFPSERYFECERKGWCEYQIHVEVVPLAALEQAERDVKFAMERTDNALLQVVEAEARAEQAERERDEAKHNLANAMAAYNDCEKSEEKLEARLKEAVGLLKLAHDDCGKYCHACVKATEWLNREGA